MEKHSPGLRKTAKFIQLLNEVLEIHSHPQDSYEIAALLESMGWNDDRGFYGVWSK